MGITRLSSSSHYKNDQYTINYYCHTILSVGNISLHYWQWTQKVNGLYLLIVQFFFVNPAPLSEVII